MWRVGPLSPEFRTMRHWPLGFLCHFKNEQENPYVMTWIFWLNYPNIKWLCKYLLRGVLFVQEARKRFDKASLIYDQVFLFLILMRNFSIWWIEDIFFPVDIYSVCRNYSSINKNNNTQYITTEWGLGRRCTKTLSLPQRWGREAVSDRPLAHDRNKLKKDVMEVQEAIGSNKTTDSSRTNQIILQSNYTKQHRSTKSKNKTLQP